VLTDEIDAELALKATETEVNNALALKTNLTGNHLGTWQGYSPTQTDPGIQAVVDEHTIQINNNNANIKNFNLIAQSSKPSKQGISSCSPKLAIKQDDDAFYIVQKANKGYVGYTFDTLNGTDVDSYGVNWELVRIKKVQHLADAYVAFTTYQNVIGTLVTSIEGTQEANALEQLLCNYDSVKAESATNKSNKSGNIGLELYYISDNSNPSSVDWVIIAGKNKKANIVLYGNATSSQDVDILVNGIVVKKEINTRMFYTQSNNPCIIEFEIPTAISQLTNKDITITIRNNSLSERLYFSCVNFINLENYNGEHVDTYKTLANTLKFISANGASDYAIKEWMGDYCGSYHGGETRDIGRINWKNSTSPLIRNHNDTSLYNFSEITNNDWCVLSNLTMFQQTNLINKAKIISEFNFDTDGSLDMSFGFYENTINIEVFYTALTATNLDFKYLTYPISKQIADLSGETEFEIVEGKITQRSASRNAEMTIRFTKFNDYLYDRKAFINATASYFKFYYGAISTIAGGSTIPNLNFSKSLDFHIW